MLDELQPAVRVAIMSILAALYESGTVEEVDLADVMKLFGVQPPPGAPITRFSFRDEGWVEAYIHFREADEGELVDVNIDFDVAYDDDFDGAELEEYDDTNETNKKLH